MSGTHMFTEPWRRPCTLMGIQKKDTLGPREKLSRAIKVDEVRNLLAQHTENKTKLFGPTLTETQLLALLDALGTSIYCNL